MYYITIDGKLFKPTATTITGVTQELLDIMPTNIEYNRINDSNLNGTIKLNPHCWLAIVKYNRLLTDQIKDKSDGFKEHVMFVGRQVVRNIDGSSGNTSWRSQEFNIRKAKIRYKAIMSQVARLELNK